MEANRLIANDSITDSYREELRSRIASGTLHELGGLSRNGSQCNPELLGQCLDGGGSVNERLSKIDFNAMLQTQRLNYLVELIEACFRCLAIPQSGQAQLRGSSHSVGTNMHTPLVLVPRHGSAGRLFQRVRLSFRILGISLSCIWKCFLVSWSNDLGHQRAEKDNES